jgi:glycosyltransferase involved in cell wall biosynthesis
LSGDRPLRVLAFIEARVLTGPAKNLIRFASRARSADTQIEVVIATYERGKPEENRFIAAARDAGIQVEVIPEKGPFDRRVIAGIRRVIENVRPDIIQTHAVKSHFLMLLTGAWRTTPWVAFHHGYTTTDWKTGMYNRLDRLSLRRPHRIVTVCGPFAEELRRRGVPAGRISIIHNAVKPFIALPEAVIHGVRSRFGLPEGVPVLVTIGRLSREKGHADLLEAVALLRNTRAEFPFRVAIVGEGPERGVLERRIAALGLFETVTLCGHQTDTAPFYAIASVVVLPSHSEGSPNVLLEAQAAGVPVVATSVGGIPEIAINGVTALLVPKGDSAALANAIATVLKDRQLAAKLGAAGRENVLSRFSPDIHMRCTLSVYMAVAGSRRV